MNTQRHHHLVLRELTYKYVAKLSAKALYRLAVANHQQNAVNSAATAIKAAKRGDHAAARQWLHICCLQLISKQVA